MVIEGGLIRMSYLSFDDVTLYYELHGSGSETLVCLHGNHEDHTYFQHQITYFKQYYQVLVVDMRSHGLSTNGAKGLSFNLFADDLYYVCQHLNLDKIHLLGFSDGASTAMTFTLKYPEMVAKLILNGANYHPFGVKLQYQLPEYLKYAYYRLIGNHKEANIKGLMCFEPFLQKQQLQQIQKPCIVVAGTDDMIRDQHLKNLARMLQAKLIYIKGDHFASMHQYALFNRRVHQFLQEEVR